MTPLDLTQATVRAHWSQLQSAIRGLPLPRAREISIAELWETNTATAALAGPAVEVTQRERGGRVAVYPLLISEIGANYWINWSERWDFVVGSRRPWRFRDSGITVFQGPPGIPNKVQLFRIEWPGFTTWQAGTVGWQAPGAGHPHWQFDALTEVEERFARAMAVTEIASSLEDEREVEEFDEKALKRDRIVYPSRAWTKMHFAAQARWNDLGWNGDVLKTEAHTHAPTDEKALRRWVTASLLYIRSELGR